MKASNLVNEEGADALGARLLAGARHDQVHVRRTAAADERLVACPCQVLLCFSQPCIRIVN